MSVLPVLESQNPYPQVVDLTLTPQPQANGGGWEIRAKFNRQDQGLTLLTGQVKVVLRAGILNIQTTGGQFTPNPDLPRGVFLGHHSISESHWQIQLAEPLDFSLGTVTPTADTAHLQSSFTVTPANVAIAEAQGLWPPDLSPNQLAIADRLIAQFLVNDYFSPALSWGQWAIGAVPPWQPLYGQPDAEVLSKTAILFGDRLQWLGQATTSDLLALASLVGLDPQRDLAGGKFVGANLSGIDLSGANLANSNFRGAILTDADLSGANLANSNFRGADLSGAYLEGADLSQVDFRKSSLALANLIGADLSGANLQGTTLNSANFSAANLSQAQLGDNPSLSPEQLAALIENGAKLLAASDTEMLS